MLQKKILSGCRIINRRILTEDFLLNGKNRFLLQGKVYTPYGIPLPDAAVEIGQVNDSVYPSEIEILGITFTDHDGSYAISLPVNNKAYIIKAYSP